MKKIKDALDIVDDYNKLTPKQLEDGYIGIPKQQDAENPMNRPIRPIKNKASSDIGEALEKPTKKKFSRKEREMLDNIPKIEERIPQKHIQTNMQLETVKNNPIQEKHDISKPRQQHEATIVPQNQILNPPIDESGDIDLNKLFSSEVGNESDVVKELFSMENIKVKTELTKDEISIISRLELQATMTQNFYLTKIIKELETLRVSKDRKSRGEFVNSFRGIGDNQTGASVFSKLGNVFKNDKV